MQNKLVVISGGSRGLGLEVMRMFVREGWRVALCGRDEDAILEAIRRCASDSPSGSRPFGLAVDVASYSQVVDFKSRVDEQLGPADVIISNAGIYGPIGSFDSNDIVDWVHAISVNLLGSANLIHAFLGDMKKRRKGRIIQISGGGATKPMPNFSAYAASKAGVVRFVETLAHELSDFGIAVNSVAPGPLNTRLLSQVLDAGPQTAGTAFYEASVKQSENSESSYHKALDLIKYLATEAPVSLTGKLISAVWDTWQEKTAIDLHVRDSERWTLRRIP